MSRIRKASHADLAQVENCAVAAYQMYVERIGRKPAPMVADFAALIEAGQLYVAEVEGWVAGFVVYYPRDDHIHLENVAVSPACQQKGIGRELVEFVEQQTLAAGFNRVELYTNAKMTENLGLYPRLGYRQFDRRLEDGFDRVYFEKDL